MNPNPLSAYFRQPNLWIKLPSQGYWWPEGSLVMPANNEISVMSMTAGDEMLLKTPDALYSGEAVVSMIQNCVPNIKNAWSMPIIDLETLLIVIRIASVGEILSVESSCPKCQESSNYDVDLKYQLSQIDVGGWKEQLLINNMQITLQPMLYSQLVQFQNKIFQNQKQLKNIYQDENQNKNEDLINSIISEINSIELEAYCACIKSIEVDSFNVTDPQYIHEFLINCEKKVYVKIRDHIDQLKRSVKCSDLKLICDKCNFEFSSTFSMDYSNFFDLSS